MCPICRFYKNLFPGITCYSHNLLPTLNEGKHFVLGVGLVILLVYWLVSEGLGRKLLLESDGDSKIVGLTIAQESVD